MNLADDLVLLHLAVIVLYLGVGEHHLPIILTEIILKTNLRTL